MRDQTALLVEAFASLSPLGDPSLSPDGRAIAFTRSAWEHSQIFILPLDRPRWPARITATLEDCTEPQWSPDGQHLVFTRGTALWVTRADGSDARKLTDHPAGNTSPRWSLDGSHIAFVSRRRGWSHLWTISADGKALTQITRDPLDAADPVWSPDSTALAFCAVDPEDLMTRGVYLTPLDGGEGERISPRGCWSGAPSFSPDGRTLAYLSDADGWFHVYLHDVPSRSVHPLTHGACEDGGPHFYDVDSGGGPLFSPDGRRVAFIRHRESQFDVWVAEVASGEARRISSKEGRYCLVAWLPDSKRIAVTFDSVAATGDLHLLSIDGPAMQLTDSSVALLRPEGMISPQWISYMARDGLPIYAALFRPRETSKAPAVLFIHGGPNFEFGEAYSPLPQLLAQEGYVVLAPNYRGSTGYGTAFRQANFREWGHADALDVIDAARWLRGQEFVDPDHLAVVGPSYGGYLTLCALTLGPDLFCAGVDLYGDSDLVESYRHSDREARLDIRRHMGTPEENPEGYRRGSPVLFAERIQAPVLILHGRQDMMVVPLMSEKMIEALRIENKYVESHFYEDEAHGFEKPHNRKDAWERVIQFLNRYCREQ